MEWFLDCLGRAIDGAQTSLGAVLATGRFWSAIAGTAINDRQRLVLNRFLDGFEGKLTMSKYAKLAKCSHDTALPTSYCSWGMEFSFATPKAGAARVTHSPIWAP
jgi:Fic family protein